MVETLLIALVPAVVGMASVSAIALFGETVAKDEA